MKKPGNDYHGKELFCTLQKSPERERRNGVLGRAKAWCQTQIKDRMGMSVRLFWFPDFTVFVEDDSENAVLICSVEEDLTVQFDEDGAKQIGFENAEAALASFNKHRRR